MKISETKIIKVACYKRNNWSNRWNLCKRSYNKYTQTEDEKIEEYDFIFTDREIGWNSITYIKDILLFQINWYFI